MGSLPFGGSDVLAQPAFVTQVIRTAEATHAEIVAGRHDAERVKIERVRADAEKKGKR